MHRARADDGPIGGRGNATARLLCFAIFFSASVVKASWNPKGL
jgi:hypothetical protein